MSGLPDVIVTNFKRRITGVTTTALRVAKKQSQVSNFSVAVCGPNQNLNRWQALLKGWQGPAKVKKRIWHVRRNNEMLWGLIARDLLRQPVKLVFTSAAIRRHSALPRWLISRMDAVIATSKLAASFVPHVKATIGHGVDVETFVPNPDRDDTCLKLICVGRIRREKGVDLIIDALCEILPRYPQLRMQFAGLVKPSDQAFYQQQLAKLDAAGVSDQVEWLGEVAPADMPAIMASSHVLVAAPVYEGFGLTPFEALACGVPVVCSDTGAFAAATGVVETSEWQPAEVRQGASGLLVNTGDKAALIAALTSLIDNEPLRQALAVTAVARARTQFTIEAEARAIDAVYQQV